MARKRAYEDRIKPQFELIKKLMNEKGATEKDIYTAIKVSRDAWYKAKKEIKEFSDFLKECRQESVNESFEVAMDKLEKPTPQYFVDLLKEKLMRRTDDGHLYASTDEIIKIAKFMYPDLDWYRVNEQNKTSIEQEKVNIMRYDVEQKLNGKEQAEVIGDVIVDKIIAISKQVDES